MTKGDGFFSGAVARNYDALHGGKNSEEIAPMVATLEDLCEGGRALEFAIGTGRVALPLAARGIDVSGIEMSRDMVAEMRRKPGGRNIQVVIGDMSETEIADSFSLVFLVYNTIDNLTTQEAQVACFANAAAHLLPGGRFVVETLVPPLQRLPFGETALAFACDEDHFGTDEFDVVSQTYTSHHIRNAGEGFEKFSTPFRYAWPAELDLMARMAGLTLEHRWSDWNRNAFTRYSSRHVSVWRTPVTASP